jgi:hypothetical protein
MGRQTGLRVHGGLCPTMLPTKVTAGPATAHLAVILTVAQPAHPVTALDVAAWVEGVLGLNPVLGVGLQAVKFCRDKAHVNI